jgi:hypothetical protein
VRTQSAVDGKENRAGIFHGAISTVILSEAKNLWLAPTLATSRNPPTVAQDDNQIKSSFGLLRVGHFLALRFQLRELLSRKNSFGLFEECLPTFLCATGFHAVGLPRFDLRLLISREIEVCQINARHRIRFRDPLGATRFVSRKRAGCC